MPKGMFSCEQAVMCALASIKYMDAIVFYL